MSLMTTRGLIECIPNISIGKDKNKLIDIAKSIQDAPETQLLHIESNTDAQRSVFTFVGSTDSVLISAQNMVRYVSQNVDMSMHTGVHPRIGAVDVCPFVDLEKSVHSLDSSVNTWAEKIAATYDIPIYLYEKSAKQASRQNLATIRKGNYEGLHSKMEDPLWKPDFGGNRFRPHFGAMVTGVRELLVALNISLPDLSLNEAKKIASEIRASSSSQYSLPGVKAIGWYMHEYNSAQVSTNITDLSATSLHTLLSTILKLASKYIGKPRYSTELIGLMPDTYLQEAYSEYQIEDFKTLSQIIHLQTKAIGIPTIEYQLYNPQNIDTLVAKAME